MVEKFFWADAIADKIIKEKGNKKEYVCASGITPSGIVHIGNFREVITTDLVVRALKERGKKVRFIYSWDDFDRFRKVPPNVPKEFEKYLGMNVSEVPSPSGAKNPADFGSTKSEAAHSRRTGKDFVGKGSYAEHFEKEFEKSLEKVDIKPELIRQSVMGKKCVYAPLIKKAIEKRKEIMEILNKYRKEPLEDDWMPIGVYCEKCKKDSTKILNAEGYFIEYQCECGFRNKIDFRKKGIVKAHWRVDWPIRWGYEKVDFEPSGIDHSVYGGSRMTGNEISKNIFDYNPPVDQLYEWVKLKGGKEFSSSAGNVLTLNEVEEIYEAEVLRYLFVSQKPRTAFQISFDNDVIKIYDDYDALEEKYYDGKADPKEKKVYEFSKLKIDKKKPERLSFRNLIAFVQAGKIEELNKNDKARAEKVKNWLEKYAGDDMKFEIQEKIKIKPTGKEKQALIELRKSLESKDYTEEELFNEFYLICEKLEIKNTEFFDIAYRAIINKERGPRLANLILVAGKDKIIKLLKQIK